MRHILTLAVLAGLLGCSTPQQKQDAMVYAAIDACNKAGFAQNSPEWKQCTLLQMQIQAQAAAARQQRADANLTNGLLLLQQSQRPVYAPAPAVVCRQMNVGMVCE